MAAHVEAALLERDGLLAEVVRKLAEAYEQRAIYLFGSRARGDAGPHSDYDILIVVADGAPREYRRNQRGYKALWGTGAAADVLVCTEHYFASRGHVTTSLPSRVMREGKLLYAA